MAHIHHHEVMPKQTERARISLEDGWGVSTDSVMPRADMCAVCSKPRAQHVNKKCLFDATPYTPIDVQQWVADYNTWARGKSIEEVLLAIAFAATGGSKDHA